MLGTPAVRQIIAKLNKSDKEEQLLIEKIASSCQKFDHKGQGRLTADDLFNVVKLQNGIDCSKDEVDNCGWYKSTAKITYVPLFPPFVSNVCFMIRSRGL